MVKRYIVHLSTGYAGMDSHDALVMHDNHTQDELEEEVYQMAVQHADSYGIYPRDEYADEEDVDLDDDCFSDNIEGYAEPYDPEKHDRHRCGGGSFEKDFQRMER